MVICALLNVIYGAPLVVQFDPPLATQRPLPIIYPIFCVGMSLYNPCYVAQPRAGGFAGHQFIYFCFADCSCPRHLFRRSAQFGPLFFSALLRRLLVGLLLLCLFAGFVAFGAFAIMLGRPLFPVVSIRTISANFCCCVDFLAGFAGAFCRCLCHFYILLLPPGL